MPATQHAPQQFVDSADGVRIAVYEEGNREGPTVVLVHGWPDSHDVWNLVADQLQDRFHLVAFDTRGVGRSTKANVDKLDEIVYNLNRLGKQQAYFEVVVKNGKFVSMSELPE